MLKTILLIFVLLFSFGYSQEGFQQEELGETTFATCAACHQQNGEGLPSAFPPFNKHLPNIEAKEGGRQYLINVVLFGLQGEIQVLSQSYNGVMPSWGNSLSDEQIAAVLNYELNSWDNADLLREDFSPITPEEVSSERELSKTAQEVYRMRPQLGIAAEE